jgi:hypothetical protein
MTFAHFGQIVSRDASTFSTLTFRDFTSLAQLAPTFLVQTRRNQPTDVFRIAGSVGYVVSSGRSSFGLPHQSGAS